MLVERLSDGKWTVVTHPRDQWCDLQCADRGVLPGRRVLRGYRLGPVRSEARPAGLLAETWNGTSWSGTILPAPPGGTLPSLAAVSCPAKGACVAVGNYVDDKTDTYRPLAERLAGSHVVGGTHARSSARRGRDREQ